jgi:hypothetical protein
LLLVVVSLFRRQPETAGEPELDDDERQYIEHRVPLEEQAEPKSVGPLP